MIAPSEEAGRRTTGRGWFAPALGPLVRDRRLAIWLAAVGVVQVAAGRYHLRTIPCPVLSTVGVPCPGCGASRACGAMLRGDLHGWLTMHAMAPCFLGAVLLFALAALLPATSRVALADWLDRVERRTGLAKLLLSVVIVYWFSRLMYAPGAFAALMKG